MIHGKLLRKYFIASVLFFWSIHSAETCTRVQWSAHGQGVIVGRTMDWGDSTKPDLWVFPRGLQRNGHAGPHSHYWQSRYGSFVVSAYGEVTVDGLNEVGLAGHVLYFKEASYGSPQAGKRVIAAGMWLQYILDTYATVAEAVEDAKNWSVILNRVHGHDVKIHIALEDESGDSAIFEVVNQKLEVHHHKKYKVLTNAPNYQTQLKQTVHCHDKADGTLSISMNSTDRFCFSSSLLERLPKPSSPEQAVAIMVSLVRTISVPFSPTNSTFYRTVIDITHGQYFFDNAVGLNLFHIDLHALDFRRGANIRHLQPMNPYLKGEVSQHFENMEKPPY